jgi:ADP-ribosylglycohydrolase
MDEDSLRRISNVSLTPPTWGRERTQLHWVAGLDYLSRFRGALLGGAIGDALGRPAEGRSAAEVERRFGRLTEFQRWRGWTGGPVGTVTDDTQLTMLVADSLLACREVVPEDLAARLIAWLPEGRGKGMATSEAVRRLADDVPWWEAGELSDGNGAAMRVAPIGLAFSTDFDHLRRVAALSAVVTHVGPMAVAGTVAQAIAVAIALHTPRGHLDPEAFIEALGAAIDDLHDPGARERRPSAGESVRLVTRLRELPSLLGLSPPQAFERLYNGAFILESLPSALWCFLRSPEDAEQVLITAANGGHDADTVAAMAGNLVGAYLGEGALPERWLNDLEFASKLRATADDLWVLAGAPEPSVTPIVTGEKGSNDQLVSRPNRRDRFVGCLLGGAVGDALGAPVEFDRWSEIEVKFGDTGVRGFEPAYGRLGAITDDTQMTLFTAEGLIRAENRFVDRGIVSVAGVLHRAYERWLLTQVGDPELVPWDPELGAGTTSGWLIAQQFLHHRRAPGNTCLSAMQERGRMGTPEHPINDSKGCGGVMRVAPVGLVARESFDLGCEIAALTHGHPSGWLAAGALAELVARVAGGYSLETAAQRALDLCRTHKDGLEVSAALEQATLLARQQPRPSAERIESLGAGWVAEEALSISVYCALTAATDFRDGVLNAVNHSGDSDSTGAITGNILGAHLGVNAIDDDLLDGLEGRQVIEQVGDDLYNTFVENLAPDWERYPPW